jgi:YD repeat-containing protein
MTNLTFSSSKRVSVLVLVLALVFAICLIADDYRNGPMMGVFQGGNITFPQIVVATAPSSFQVNLNPGSGVNFWGGSCSGTNGLGASNKSATLTGPTTIILPILITDPAIAAGGGVFNCGGNFGTLPNTDYNPFQFKVAVQTFGFPAAGVSNDFVGDPVSTGTGELYQAFPPDLDLGGPLPLVFQRYYGSLIKVNGVTTRLGNNWMHNFEWALNVSGSTAIVTFYGGKAISFTKTGTNWLLSAPARAGYQFASPSAGTYQLLDPRTNLVYTFGGTGATLGLTQIQDRNGNTLTVTQPSNGTASVSDGLGRTLTFTFDSSGRIITLADMAGRTVSFGYTGSDLTRFTDANGKSENYAVTIASVLTGLLTSRTLPLGNKPFSQTSTNSAGSPLNWIAATTPPR